MPKSSNAEIFNYKGRQYDFALTDPLIGREIFSRLSQNTRRHHSTERFKQDSPLRKSDSAISWSALQGYCHRLRTCCMNANTHQPVFTIGHSNLEFVKFFGLLKQHGFRRWLTCARHPIVNTIRSSTVSHCNAPYKNTAYAMCFSVTNSAREDPSANVMSTTGRTML